MVLAVGGEALHTRIKKLRKSLDLTQQKFADALGIKQTTVASYEIGRIVPSDSTIKLICREFDVNEGWLRTGDGEMFVLPSRDDQISRWAATILQTEEDSFKKRFVAALSQLDERDWVALEQFLLNIKKDPEE